MINWLWLVPAFVAGVAVTALVFVLAAYHVGAVPTGEYDDDGRGV